MQRVSRRHASQICCAFDQPLKRASGEQAVLSASSLYGESSATPSGTAACSASSGPNNTSTSTSQTWQSHNALTSRQIRSRGWLLGALGHQTPACAQTAYGSSWTPSHGFAAAFSSSSSGRRGARTGTAEAEVLPTEAAARMVMSDPMSRLMASQGMPVGLSLGATGGAAGGSSRRRPGGAEGGDASDDEAAALAAVTRPPAPEPAYDMEAFSDMLRAAAKGRAQPQQQPSSPSGGGSGGEGGAFGVQAVGASPLDDAWGTTRESPADIARRIAEGNRRAGIGGPGGLAEGEEAAEGEGESEDDEDPLAPPGGQLSPSEAKYASLEAMSAEIKKLDEVFEVLASVPWLDEDNLADKELKGVAMVGLLGTLEEVGFNIRPQLMRIWAGERGAELASAPGLEYRDQAALIAVLYHTQQIEEAHGPPQGGYMAAQGARAGEGGEK